MRYKVILIISIVISLLSCNRHESLVPIQELSFDIGFESRSKFEGVFYDHIYQDSLFYFADPVTEKKIMFFDRLGNKKDSVSLVNGLNKILNIEDLIIVSRDTILLNNNYSGSIVVLNKKGDIWHRINLNQYDSLGNYYEYKFTSLNKTLLKNNSLLTASKWYGNKFEENKHFETEAEKTKYFYNRVAKEPYFMKVSNIFSENPVQIYALKNFYNKFVKDKSLIVEGNSYYVTDDKILVSSSFSSKVFVYNLHDFSLIKEIEILPPNEAVSIAPLITDSGLSHELNDELRSKSMITNIGYSKSKKKYVFQRRKDISKNKKTENIPFELIVLNDNFKVDKTLFFDGVDYLWYGSFITENNIFLLSKNKNRYGVKNYGLFKI
ncbi:hypothetical protein [Myroides sp. DF42-4-2]|uniref:hypothetical protein n=1 Tax=Myroides sp. DF42-4-2 TaxID=2746726 RepID=UPI00257707C9|nr:hypothetical protein [Myroides sp. DF42-4-2]MDM1409090.1 hypothetical protein [Myroides sp. DF42-4-2]